MTSIKKLATALMLGLVLTLSSAAFAQNAQSEAPAKDSCCAMTNCCKGDSCPMKKGAKNHAKKHSAKDAACCCCGSDSCEMKMKDKQDKSKG